MELQLEVLIDKLIIITRGIEGKLSGVINFYFLTIIKRILDKTSMDIN